MALEGKNRLQQECLTPRQVERHDLPRSLEELSEKELQTKRIVGKVTSSVLNYLSCKLADSGFEWLLPVILSQSTDPLWPDQNASIEKRLEVEIYGKTVRPTASMIVHKLVACSLVHPRLFILSPNIRIEKSSRATTGKHVYEFTQIDFEARDMTSEAVRTFVNGILCGLVQHLKKHLDDDLNYLRNGQELQLLSENFGVYDRRVLEEELGINWESKMIDESDQPFWVTNFAREFYDFEDFKTGEWDNFDLFMPGHGEVLSGARREFEHWKIIAKMDRCGVRKGNYQVLLRLAKEGRLKSTAGAGIGLERLVSWLVGAKHVGEVQLFPRIPGKIHEL